jgi:hypothetical protein
MALPRFIDRVIPLVFERTRTRAIRANAHGKRLFGNSNNSGEAAGEKCERLTETAEAEKGKGWQSLGRGLWWFASLATCIERLLVSPEAELGTAATTY